MSAMKKTIRAGVIGAAGYTGGELIRLLLHHPQVELAFAHSKSQAGKPLWLVHTDLLGDTELRFSDTMGEADVLFLCVAHGEAKKFLAENKIPKQTKLIDLSEDHRLDDSFVYGLPELNRERIRKATRVANPGCFATAIQLALLPLASKKVLQDEAHVSATTGSTGAGQALSASTHFSWRNNNLSAYKAFEHQHVAEIRHGLKFPGKLHFVPYRGGFTRGIFAGVYTGTMFSQQEAQELYDKFYKEHPFVHRSEQAVDLKQVTNTNKCLLHLELHDQQLFITSVIDNLLKGASGQAVQNMNLMCGFEETAGLKLKALAF